MIWVDYIVIAIIVVSTIISLMRGFVRQLISLFSWVLAFYIALRFGPALSAHLADYITLEPARRGIAFFLLFVVVVLFGSLVGLMASKLVSAANMGLGDRLLGMLFGAARGIIVVLILTFFLGLSPLAEEPWWNQSPLLAYSRELMLLVLSWMPENLGEILRDRLQSFHSR